MFIILNMSGSLWYSNKWEEEEGGRKLTPKYKTFLFLVLNLADHLQDARTLFNNRNKDFGAHFL